MPLVQLLPPQAASIIQYPGLKKYPEDRTVITHEEMSACLVRNEKHVQALLKDLKDITHQTPHQALGRLQEMFQYLEHYRLYEIADHRHGKLFYHERNLRNVYRSRKDMSYHHQELWESTRRYPGLEGLKLSDYRACIQAEPQADRFLNYLKMTINRLARHVAQLIKESSDSKIPHYQYNAFVDCVTGVRDASLSHLLNPIFSEQYFPLLPDGPNKRVYNEAVRLARRYGAVRPLLETNTLLELVDYAQVLADLVPELDYAVIRGQYEELMNQQATPNMATYNFYDYQKRHEDHYDGRIIPRPGAGEKVRALAFRKEAIVLPSEQEASFYLVAGRETNQLIQCLVETMERIRSFSMLQTTYERFRQSDQEEGLQEEGDS